MRKPDFCTCENKDEADQGLRFLYMDSKIPLLPKSEITSLLPSSIIEQHVCVGPGRKPEDQFSHNEARILALF